MRNLPFMISFKSRKWATERSKRSIAKLDGLKLSPQIWFTYNKREARATKTFHNETLICGLTAFMDWVE